MPGLKHCSALVLAGGLGKRLRSVYRAGPKCMVPVGGRRFLEYLLLWLRTAGFRDAILCAGYKELQLKHWLGDGSRFGVHARYSVETAPLGTGGALKHAQTLISTED